jgi:DNA mismatch repair protein MutL
VELITKTRDSVTGISYRIEGGEEIAQEEIGAPDGTTFLIKDIFYNTPARRKFLKSAQTEGLYISELVERIAMSRPDISFRLIMNGQNKLYTSGNGKQRDVIYTIFGKEIAQNLLPVKLKLSGLSMSGFIGKPVISRGNRNMENYFINGRYVRSKILYKAIEDAYKPYMMQHKYPFTVLMLDIPPELLDVNVHPAKMELRFRQEEALYQEIKKALEEALSKRELVVEAHLPETKPLPVQTPVMPVRSEKDTSLKTPETTVSYESCKRPVTEPERVAEPEKTYQVPAPKRVPEPFETLRTLTETGKQAMMQVQDAEQMELFDDRLLSKQARSKHRLIGQLFGTYWLIEYEQKLFIIDQHAAHEKVLYERTMKQLQNQQAASQMLQPSVMLDLTQRQRITLEAHMEYFTKMGFEIEPFGGNSYTISAVPANLLSLNQVDLFMELLDDLSDDFGHGSSQTILDRVATMSCKAAVKGNTTLTEAEADALIDELLTLDNPYACPHGRPTIISMTKYEIEKKFKRIV